MRKPRKAASPAEGKQAISMPEKSAHDVFKSFGGSESPEFNSTVLREVIGTIWMTRAAGDTEAKAQAVAAAAAALKAFKPTNEIEAMLAAQATALHFGAMECLRRTMIPEQPAEIASRLRRDGVNMARAMTDMLEALDRKRGKGPQVVRVERVVVQEGGQAIVGNVQGGTAAATRAAAVTPRAIGQELPGMTLDSLASPAPVEASRPQREG